MHVIPLPAPSAAHPAAVTHRELAIRSNAVDTLLAPWNRPAQPGAAVIVVRDGKVCTRADMASPT